MKPIHIGGAILVAAAVLVVLYQFRPPRLTDAHIAAAMAAQERLDAVDAVKQRLKEEQAAAAAAEEEIEAADIDEQIAAEPAAEPVRLADAGSAATAEEASAAMQDLPEEAPDTFKVKFVTTAGDFIAEFHKDWAPHGAQRVWDMARTGFFEDIAFFRVIDGFMAQFGIHGNPGEAAEWEGKTLPKDKVAKSNTRGRITFAMRGSGGAETTANRTTQLFINFGDNSNLDRMGFAPVGEVVEGMQSVDNIYSGYGEGAPRGRGPSQGLIQQRGNEYLKSEFPNLDFIEYAEIMTSDASAASQEAEPSEEAGESEGS